MTTPAPIRRPPLVLLLASGVVVASFIGLCFQAGWLPFSFSPDGRVYVDVARHTIAGDGLQRSWTHWDDPRDAAPMVHYAPAYPLTLAACSWLSGADPADCAPWLNALLLGLTTGISGWLVWTITKRRGPCLLAMGTLCALKAVWVCHTQALSEPLFLALLLFTLTCLLRYAETLRWGTLLMAAAGAGGCVLTRYQGAFLLPIGVLWVWMMTQAPVRQRLGRATSWLAAAMVPISCWQFRNMLLAANQPVRELGIHWPDREAWWSLHNTVTGWFSTTSLPSWIRLALPIAAACLTLALLWRHGQRRWLFLGGLVCATQLIFLLTVRTFFDAAMPFDDRILSSIGVLVVLSMVVAMARWTWPHSLASALALILGITVLTNIGSTLRIARPSPTPTARPQWLIQLSSLGPRRTVYTNRAGEIIWYARQPAKYLPERTEEVAEALVQRLRHTAGVVVYFHATSGREHLIPLAALAGRPDLAVSTTAHATLLTPLSVQSAAYRAPAGAPR